ncbi:MAG: GNAT family N-acetyltransferase [Anaerolineaceae bacterium]|nr:GNAT family N-acetyltransferase [Anaerolineaceae bacterium]
MTYFQKITGTKCYLSPCVTADAEQWTRWLNDLEVAIPLGDEAYELITQTNQENTIKEITADGNKVFTIVDRETDQPIGRCLLFFINSVDRRAMMGIFIGEKQYWNQGYGTEATQLLLDYAFNLLNLNRVELGVFAFNQRGIQAYKKAGFKEIGIRHQFRWIGGQAFDMVMMDILADEFKSPYVKPILERILS